MWPISFCWISATTVYAMYDYCSFVKTEQNANMSASKSSSHHISPNGGMS